MRSEDGQATTEYVALIALLAVLLAVVAGVVAVGAPGVANAVLGQLRRALCLVGGGDCPVAPRRPCTVASTRDSRHLAVNLGIVRLDEDHVALLERLSDGTVRLTLSERDGAGVEGGIGGRLKVDLGRHHIAVDREARLGGQGVLGHGSVYYVPSERAARELLRQIERPPPDEVFYEAGARGLGRLLAGTAGGIDGLLDGLAEANLGARHDRRSGDWTISLGAGGAGAGLLSVTVGGGMGALDGQAVLGLTLDRHGTPSELSVTARGTAGAGTSLPSGVADALKQAADPRLSSNAGGRRWEIGARADLRDPAMAAAWKAFRAAPASVAAVRALGEQLHANASIDIRTYRLDSAATGAGGAVAVGVKIGGEFIRTTDRARLLAAATRPPFGLWEARVDCVG